MPRTFIGILYPLGPLVDVGSHAGFRSDVLSARSDVILHVGSPFLLFPEFPGDEVLQAPCDSFLLKSSFFTITCLQEE